MARIYHCQCCGSDVSLQDRGRGEVRWVDTRGNALCPSWQSTFHSVNPVDIPDAPEGGGGGTSPDSGAGGMP